MNLFQLIAVVFVTLTIVGTAHADHADNQRKYYEFFESEREASYSFQNTVDRLRFPVRQKPKLVSYSPPGNRALYQKLKEDISQVMTAYRELYPEFRNLPNPIGLIIKNKEKNAFVFNHNVNLNNKAPFYIVVNTGSFGQEVDNNSFIGLLAHELSHLLFKHGRGTIQEKFYLANLGAHSTEKFGFEMENDPRIERMTKKYQESLKVVKEFNKLVKLYKKYKRSGNYSYTRYYLSRIRSINQNKVRSHFSTVQKMQRENDVARFRWYTSEDHADITSVRVLHQMGENPIGIGKFNLGWLTPSKRQECKAQISRGEEIDYGTLTDNHHGDCWRYYRAIRLANTLL